MRARRAPGEDVERFKVGAKAEIRALTRVKTARRARLHSAVVSFHDGSAVWLWFEC